MINEHYTPEAVILANGEYPTCPVPLTMLEEASFVACCDGAANEYISRGHTPDVIVGDGDSLSTEYHKRFSPIIHQIPDQETNDQTKAVRYLQKRGFRRIAIVGATGGWLVCRPALLFPVSPHPEKPTVDSGYQIIDIDAKVGIQSRLVIYKDVNGRHDDTCYPKIDTSPVFQPKVD